jgi:hypothetical protein
MIQRAAALSTSPRLCYSFSLSPPPSFSLSLMCGFSLFDVISRACPSAEGEKLGDSRPLSIVLSITLWTLTRMALARGRGQDGENYFCQHMFTGPCVAVRVCACARVRVCPISARLRVSVYTHAMLVMNASARDEA